MLHTRPEDSVRTVENRYRRSDAASARRTWNDGLRRYVWRSTRESSGKTMVNNWRGGRGGIRRESGWIQCPGGAALREGQGAMKPPKFWKKKDIVRCVKSNFIFIYDHDFWDFLFIIIIRLIYNARSRRIIISLRWCCVRSDYVKKMVCIIFCIIYLIPMFVSLGFTISTMKCCGLWSSVEPLKYYRIYTIIRRSQKNDLNK